MPRGGVRKKRTSGGAEFGNTKSTSTRAVYDSKGNKVGRTTTVSSSVPYPKEKKKSRYGGRSYDKGGTTHSEPARQGRLKGSKPSVAGPSRSPTGPRPKSETKRKVRTGVSNGKRGSTKR